MLTGGQIVSVTGLGAAIRQKRRAMGVRQDELARMSGVGVRFLSELERGKATCEVGKILQVMERLGLTLWLAPRGTMIETAQGRDDHG